VGLCLEGLKEDEMEASLPAKLRWCPVRAYIVAGLVRMSLVSGVGVGLTSVELRFKAADATKPPAPRVDEGIIHGIDGFAEVEISSFSVFEGNDSVRFRL